MRTLEKILFTTIIVGATVLGGHFGFARQSAAELVTANSNLRAVPIVHVITPAPVFVLSSPAIPPVKELSSEERTLEDILRVLNVPTMSLSSASPPPIAPTEPEVPRPQVTLDDTLLVANQAVRPPVFRPVGVLDEPVISAETALVSDLLTGESFFSLAADRRWPIASISKLMTAVLVKDVANLDDRVTLTDNDFPPEDTTTKKWLKVGETYTVRDLLTAALTVSSNEAAQALANHVGTDFVSRMNAKAMEWGLSNTYFADPTGLSPTNQSTPKDLERFTFVVWDKYDDLLAMTRKVRATIYDETAKRRQTLQNINPLAGEIGFVGGKTGYTDDARGNLLTIFLQDRRPVFVVVLGANDRFGETNKLISWFKNSFRATVK